jgi:hypothetical protein
MFPAIVNLSAEEAAKGETLRTLDVKIATKLQTLSQQDQQIGAKSELLASYDDRIAKSEWQYEFFGLFVSMLLNSPSAAESAADLGVAPINSWAEIVPPQIAAHLPYQ